MQVKEVSREEDLAAASRRRGITHRSHRGVDQIDHVAANHTDLVYNKQTESWSRYMTSGVITDVSSPPSLTDVNGRPVPIAIAVAVIIAVTITVAV